MHVVSVCESTDIAFYSHHGQSLMVNLFRFPPYMSPLARSLVHGLLSRDPRWRLGAKGVDEVIVMIDFLLLAVVRLVLRHECAK